MRLDLGERGMTQRCANTRRDARDLHAYGVRAVFRRLSRGGARKAVPHPELLTQRPPALKSSLFERGGHRHDSGTPTISHSSSSGRPPALTALSRGSCSDTLLILSILYIHVSQR